MTDKKERPAHDAYDIVPAKAADYPMLVDIWEASVRATHTLEMLVVHPDFVGRGLGRALLSFAIREKGVTRVDVNEQNKRAEGFYRAHGFRTTSRDETDADGLPYPILHMALRQ